MCLIVYGEYRSAYRVSWKSIRSSYHIGGQRSACCIANWPESAMSQKDVQTRPLQCGNSLKAALPQALSAEPQKPRIRIYTTSQSPQYRPRWIMSARMSIMGSVPASFSPAPDLFRFVSINLRSYRLQGCAWPLKVEPKPVSDEAYSVLPSHYTA